MQHDKLPQSLIILFSSLVDS